MYISLPAEEAQTRYPTQYAEILSKRANGRSKAKLLPLSDLTWGFSWCQTVALTKPTELQALFASENDPAWTDAPVGTIDEELEKECSTCASIALFAQSTQNRRAHWDSDTLITEVPLEIKATIRGALEARRAEEARFAAMSPTDAKSEVDVLLQQLSKSPGFFAVKWWNRPQPKKR